MTRVSIYTIILCIQLFVLGYLLYYIFNPNFTDIHSGQKWVYGTESNNPFEQTVLDTNTVISVKGDYVLYENQRGYKNSASKRYFLIGSKLIK